MGSVYYYYVEDKFNRPRQNVVAGSESSYHKVVNGLFRFRIEDVFRELGLNPHIRFYKSYLEALDKYWR